MSESADVAQYIGSMCVELAQMAEQSKMDELARLLTQAAIEAGRQLGEPATKPPGRLDS